MRLFRRNTWTLRPLKEQLSFTKGPFYFLFPLIAFIALSLITFKDEMMVTMKCLVSLVLLVFGAQPCLAHDRAKIVGDTWK